MNLLPYAVAALFVFAVYRRLRRNFGLQPVNPKRMGLRLALLVVLGGVLLPVARKSPEFLLAVIGGAAIGVALGYFGSQRTRFQTTAGQLYYIPHTLTGVAVSLLVVGRLAYRAIAAYMSGPGSAAPAIGAAYASSPGAAFAPPQMMQSPLTVGVLFVLVGYYVWFYAWILWKSKHIEPQDIEAPASPT